MSRGDGLTPQQRRERVQEIIAAAIAAGTHGPGIGVVCQGCRNLVEAYYHRTTDRRWICEACWKKSQGIS